MKTGLNLSASQFFQMFSARKIDLTNIRFSLSNIDWPVCAINYAEAAYAVY